MSKRKFTERRKNHPMQKLLERNYKSRLRLSIFVLVIFLLVVVGIVFAIYTNAPLNQEWKEVLLLLLGAFIGAFGKVMDFWFANADKDRDIIARADHEDNGHGSHPDKIPPPAPVSPVSSSLELLCETCGQPTEDQNNIIIIDEDLP